MLTRTDLNQIRDVVKEEITVQLDPVKKDLGLVKKDLGLVKKDVKTLKRDVSQIRKDQGTMLDLLDKEQMQQRKRIARLEEHAGLQTPQ